MENKNDVRGNSPEKLPTVQDSGSAEAAVVHNNEAVQMEIQDNNSEKREEVPTTDTPARRRISYAVPISGLIERVKSQPASRHIFRGINHPGMGAIFGPAKGGKTTLAECLLLTMSAGQAQFIGEPLHIPIRRVLTISCEEFYISRTNRNIKQIEYVNATFPVDEEWVQNYIVVDENFPRYIHTNDDWAKLEVVIEEVEPAAVVIDSLSRLTIDAIEESTVASKLMKRLRTLAYKHGITLVIIHHSQKLSDQPLTMANMAGSRILSQEMDFIIGVNRLSNGIRYLSDIAYRYHPDDSDRVLAFAINENMYLEPRGYSTEHELISKATPTELSLLDKKVLQYFIEHTKNDPSIVVEHMSLYKHFVESKVMSKPTLHTCLRTLEESELIAALARGQYGIVVPGQG